jgi:DNA-binding NarL/FixJ family response regulator
VKPTRVLIADDHEVVRQGIRIIVQSSPNFEICGEASDGRHAVQLAAQLKPDIVVIDIGMPQLNGLDATKQIVQHDRRIKVLVLTMHESELVVTCFPRSKPWPAARHFSPRKSQKSFLRLI